MDIEKIKKNMTKDHPNDVEGMWKAQGGERIEQFGQFIQDELDKWILSVY